jgi:hypothetical protein
VEEEVVNSSPERCKHRAMRSLISTEVKCPGCEFKTRVGPFKYPGVMETVCVPFFCKGCESKFFAKVKRHPKEAGRVHVGVKLIKGSDIFWAIIKEMENAKEAEKAVMDAALSKAKGEEKSELETNSS